MAAAQPAVDSARVRALLESPELADTAWGAYYAGTLNDPALRPILVSHLRDALRDVGSGPTPGQNAYINALLDGLIQSGAEAPVDVLMPAEPYWRAQALILLSRAQNTESALLALRERQLTHPEWLAVNNLLLALRSGEFFTRSVMEAKFTNTFDIHDRVRSSGQPSGSGLGNGIPSGQPRAPAGFPELVYYYIQESPEGSGGGILADGPQCTYFRRASPSDRRGSSQTSDSGRQGYLLRYLATWNHLTPLEEHRAFRSWEVVNWTTAADFDKTLREHLDQQVAAIRAYLEKARQNGAPNLRGKHLQIEAIFVDRRDTAHDPLPEERIRDFVVE